MITDEQFRIEMDAILKRQGLRKKERNEAIASFIKSSTDYDELLEQELVVALEIEQQKKKQNEIPLESTEQKDLVRWFKQVWPEHKIVMVRNDGTRTFAERPEQILMGLCAGAADLYIPFLHCWVEMKRQKGGKLSGEQEEFMAYVKSIGDAYIVGYGASDARQKIMGVYNDYNKS